MRCDQCGTKNPDDNNYCGQCGVRLLRHPIPAFAESATASAPGTGSALSSLGVTGIDVSRHDEPAVPATDPIKPASYLLDQDIPEVPHSIANTEAKPAKHETTISGPSFLGLTGNSASDDADYLIQDDPAPRRGGWVIFTVVAIIVFVAVGWLEWNTLKAGHIKLPFGNSSASTAASPAPTPAANQGSTTDTTGAATPTSNEQEKLTTTDSNSATADTGAPQAAKPAAGDASAENPKAANDSPTSEAAAVEASQNRQVNEAKQRREAAAAQDPSTVKTDIPKTPTRPEPREKKPDPQQNKMLLLGEKYLYGRGVPANCPQAMVYFRAAAEDNNAPAMAHLGALYHTGQCVKQDRAQAYTWLKRAHDADPANQWYEHDMTMLWRDMSTQERTSIAR